MDRVVVRVPATTANLGPGFDSLGLALDIYNTVIVEQGSRFSISISGEGAGSISQGADNRVYQAFVSLCERAGKAVPRVSILCQNEIPLARGLGSSAAAVAGGLLTANLLCGEPLAPPGLLNLGTILEGHPDNIAAALFGGCQVVVRDGESVVAAQVPLPPGLKAVLFIPDFEMPTAKARSILPQQVSRDDAIFNLGRVALLVSSLVQDRPQHLRLATQDRLHQPARQALFPAMGKIFDGALGAGALGVFLSGAGSTVLALTQNNETAIAQAMLSAATEAGVGGSIRVAQPSILGAHAIARG